MGVAEHHSEHGSLLAGAPVHMLSLRQGQGLGVGGSPEAQREGAEEVKKALLGLGVPKAQTWDP